VWTEIFQKIYEFYEQNEIKTISKSENSIILGISHRDDQINAIVNTIFFQIIHFVVVKIVLTIALI
jgi:hypothetical protein